MKKMMFLMLAVCFLLAGCGKSGEADTQQTETPNVNAEVKQEPAAPVEPVVKQEPAEPAVEQETGVTIHPLPDTTMDDLKNATISVSLEEGDAYVDDAGIMQMAVTIYSHDQYDLAQIAELKVGDTIVTHDGDVKVSTLERGTGGTFVINGGPEAGGMELATDDSTIFYEIGFNDAKNWHKVGEATIRVSADFVYYDRSDPETEKTFYPGSFLVGEVTDYHFTPHNTTIRMEDGQIVEMIRVYVP